MDCEFRWNEWNIEHLAEHGVAPRDAEYLIRTARPPYPEALGSGKFWCKGQAENGMYMQAIFVVDADKTLYVIHARPLDDAEKRRFRRRHR